MKAIPKDYQAPEQNYASFADGEYQVKGITWFSKEQGSGRPILVAQKDGKLVGRLHFNLVDGNEGPPMSIVLSEMSLLARAFGVDLRQPCPSETQVGMISQYMAEIETSINAANKTLKVKCSGGWVNTVPGMEVPPGYYYFHLVDISPNNKQGFPEPKVGQFGKFFFATFEIDAGEGGSDTPYKGSRFNELVNYAVDVVEGVPDWQRTKSGQWTAAGQRLSNLVTMTAPAFSSADFNPPDPNNLLPYWKQNIQPHTLKGSRIKDDKGRVGLLWQSLEEVVGFKSQVKSNQPEDTDTKARKIFVEIINTLTGGRGAIEEGGNYKFTPEGSAQIAKIYISPLKAQGLIQGTTLGNLTFDDMDKIVKTMPQDQIKELVANFTLVGVRLDEFGGGEFEESPF